jgi:hypothetical protein
LSLRKEKGRAVFVPFVSREKSGRIFRVTQKKRAKLLYNEAALLFFRTNPAGARRAGVELLIGVKFKQDGQDEQDIFKTFNRRTSIDEQNFQPTFLSC